MSSDPCIQIGHWAETLRFASTPTPGIKPCKALHPKIGLGEFGYPLPEEKDRTIGLEAKIQMARIFVVFESRKRLVIGRAVPDKSGA
jgi:hypothetical protein